jgi:hypothetical protein
MSEGTAHAEQASTARRRRPADGDGLRAQPGQTREHSTHAWLGVAIIGSIVAVYAVAGYCVYLALAAIL